MKQHKLLATVAGLCGLAAVGHSQVIVLPALMGFNQPYKGQRSSFTSVVTSCISPTPAPFAAADDFWFADNFTINHFRWWGTVSSLAQRFRPYYVAIYQDAGCAPGAVVYEGCVVPVSAPAVAVDCTGKNVYSFYAPLSGPLPIAPGHYWFRVAESDADSVQQGSVDFKWSGRRPVRACPAGQHDAAGVWTSPLLDACDGQADDLSFCVLG